MACFNSNRTWIQTLVFWAFCPFALLGAQLDRLGWLPNQSKPSIKRYIDTWGHGVTIWPNMLGKLEMIHLAQITKWLAQAASSFIVVDDSAWHCALLLHLWVIWHHWAIGPHHWFCNALLIIGSSGNSSISCHELIRLPAHLLRGKLMAEVAWSSPWIMISQLRSWNGYFWLLGISTESKSPTYRHFPEMPFCRQWGCLEDPHTRLIQRGMWGSMFQRCFTVSLRFCMFRC